MTPDVTVIIPTHNSARTLRRTLDSVFEQSLGMDRIEIIVVNDGSTDGTADELDRLAAEHPNMTVIHRKRCSGGPSRPRNVALGKAKGRFVHFIDDDDYFSPEALERLVRCADEQGSDIVIGRMAGAGGRRPPKSMFTSTQPVTNVFESRAWWTLNPLKLFRRDLIERLGLRFREGLVYEDQPFTGEAYLNAQTISILSDCDYLFWAWRDDGSNITLGDIPLDRLTSVLEVMIPLIVDNVEAGPSRDHLLKRHFEMEFFEIFEFMVRSDDARAISQAFSRLREWALAYFPYEVVWDLSPAHRITHSLLRQGKLELLLDFMRHYASDPAWEVLVEGDRVYAVYPFFRDAEANVPAECFEVTWRVKVRHALSDISWRDGVLHLEGLAYIDLLDSGQTESELVLRERASRAEYTLPITRTATPGHPTEMWRKPFTHDCAGISADIDPLTAADGDRLPAGVWDVCLRLTAQGVTREDRIGRHRAPEIDGVVRWRVLPADSRDGAVVGSYFTIDFGNLSLDVDATNHPIPRWFTTGPVSWNETRKGVLAIACEEDVIGLGPSTLEVVVANDAGVEFASPVSVENGAIVAEIDVRRAARGRSLPPGTWSIRVRAKVGDLSAEHAPATDVQLESARYWRMLWPHVAMVSAPAEPLTLRIARAGVARPGVSRT